MTCKIIISGYFCTGKTSAMEYLNKEFGLKKVKDYTTRKMRKNESEGNPYYFISEERFSELEKMKKLFDPIQHAGNKYGTDLDALNGEGKWVLDILPDSWDKYSKLKGVIGIYLAPPPEEVLKERASKRGDSKESVKMRLEAIKQQDLSSYDYVIEPQESLEALCQKLGSIVKITTT